MVSILSRRNATLVALHTASAIAPDAAEAFTAAPAPACRVVQAVAHHSGVRCRLGHDKARTVQVPVPALRSAGACLACRAGEALLGRGDDRGSKPVCGVHQERVHQEREYSRG